MEDELRPLNVEGPDFFISGLVEYFTEFSKKKICIRLEPVYREPTQFLFVVYFSIYLV